MDTKWKNMKKGISFIVFFAGLSLTLGSGIRLGQNMSGSLWRHPDQALQEDYQQSRGFREYISSRLESFLAMATNSFGSNYYDFYGYTGSSIDVVESETTVAQGGAAPWESISQKEVEDPITDEQREKLRQIAAQQYHDSIKGNQNLLYSIAYDGEVLYTNSEQLATDGSSAPEGYNFLLRYADGRVRIFKDGQELDVYGDGYYREDSQWYVPGYRNFTADEETQKAVVCMAVAKEPVLYMESAYHRGSYRQLENSLYWMRYYFLSARRIRIASAIGLAAGLTLSVMAFLCRKTRLKANADIARFTGKIWFEGKLLLMGVVLYLLFFFCYRQLYQSYGGALTEITYLAADAVNTDYGYTFSVLGSYLGQMLSELPAWMWLALFWLAYLAVNDLRHNRRVWEHGLIARLRRSFTAKGLRQPLSVRAARRNGIAFAAAACFGILMLAAGVLGFVQGAHSSDTVWGMGSLFFLILMGFLILQYRIGMKNMELARDLEALSDRIRDIRDGNYYGDGEAAEDGGFSENTDSHSALAGHDLGSAMAQLEDIRHGMKGAVDEQMKSERMKVELIANVSHDIKTPLTSIISYVQFLKEEKALPEHVQDYIRILDEKSQRLKNMVQDVFAVSKAASGELPVHMEELDFGKLLRQTLADMEEQIRDSRVTFRTELPDAPVMILADGQRMYRVFQNLFQNALQYSLDGSRVFVTLRTDGRLAVASVKNTSRQELDGDKDFTERFTRGDQSRTDGGSGLGLSIAQSFTQACGGQFHWETNADLFVVTVSFQTLEDGA